MHATWVSHVLNRCIFLVPTMCDECTHVVSTLRCVGALTALCTGRDKMGTKRESREAKRNRKRNPLARLLTLQISFAPTKT